ncbi:MAG: flavin reductase family protein [Bacteroidota bacterium]
MYFSKADIKQMGRVERLKLINSLSGIKPANLVGTISDSGETNLAIISSVVHIGSLPPLLGFFMRPTGEIPRHTYQNIKANGVFTINHVKTDFIEKAHYTSAKFDQETSEFDACRLTAQYLEDFKAPFVEESAIKLGMELREEIPIQVNGTILIIGEIVHIHCPEHAFSDDNRLDLSKADGVGISGLNSYYSLEKMGSFPYARVNEVPEFNKKN